MNHDMLYFRKSLFDIVMHFFCYITAACIDRIPALSETDLQWADTGSR